MPNVLASLLRFARFSAVGLVCAALNLLILWTATYVLELHHLVATAASFFVVNLLGYFLNLRITFQDRDLGEEKRLWRYYAVMGISLVLNLGMMALLIDGADFSVVPASLVVTAIFVLFNFWNHSGWTYAPKHAGSGMSADDN